MGGRKRSRVQSGHPIGKEVGHVVFYETNYNMSGNSRK